MIFNSDVFVIFAALFFPAYFLTRGVRTQNVVVLLGSYVFYGWWDWRFLGLIGLSSVFNYAMGELVRRHGTRPWVAVAVVFNLGMLGLFKYYNFFVTEFVTLLGDLGFAASGGTLRIILPVGISFFTFQALSYVIDVARGDVKTRVSLLEFAAYLALFPQLVAGPIIRAARLLPQLQAPRRFRWPAFWIGAEQILVGLVLKVVIADRVAPLVDKIFDAPDPGNAAALGLGVLLFAFQIYCDFAGYSLIAIGLGRIMGFDFPANFRRPYLAQGFSDFWRRWHISLSSWLRDYLYIPLGGNRGGNLATYRNLMLTMVLGGLWHGAAWTFVIWGALHGGYLALERALLGRPRAAGLLRRWVRRLVVFALVCLAWVFFRAESLSDAVTVVRGIVVPHGFNISAAGPKFQIAIALALIGTLMLVEAAIEDSATVRRLRRVRPMRIACALILILSLPLLGIFGGGAFVYFQF